MNGDLISREALKKALKSSCDLCHDKNTNWCEHCCPLNDFEDLIDNAPTVDIRNKGGCEDCEYFGRPITSEPCCNCTLAHGSCFKEKEKVKDDRPQGEWKVKTLSTFPQYQPDEYECPFCKTIVNYKTNFCHNCGADMRKGGAE